ncbi:hypothetical protein JYU34_013084 [Plutella xylostella]|uniref:Uncharacterized protein n=1 Tax=Plutella xylostella TaxID=51655 RepID=A0ABQ7QDT8_PLUXY|nr:hypothetical protein JYU34_013084 [Plutella xylostella]
MEDKLRARIKSSKKGPLIVDVNKGIDMIKSGGYAFHAQIQNANERISKTFDKMELCKLGSLLSMPYNPLYPAIPKKSPFKEFFVWSLHRLNERGFMSYVQRRLASRDISCDGSIPRALALGGAAPAFALLALGGILSLNIMVVEMVLFRISKRNKMTPYLN